MHIKHRALSCQLVAHTPFFTQPLLASKLRWKRRDPDSFIVPAAHCVPSAFLFYRIKESCQVAVRTEKLFYFTISKV